MAFTYKVLGQAAPANTSNADLYTVGAGKSAVVSSIHIANVTSAVATFRLYLRIGGAAASDANCLGKDISIAANSLFSLSEGMTLSATDVVTVQSSVASALTFTLSGSEVS
jgi:hypothetical protein